jgi:inhibitor of KinA sporulation pathway (predicted exonuclease)
MSEGQKEGLKLNFIVFDLEATCDDQTTYWDNEIIEIGAVKFLNNRKVDTFQTFVKPKDTVITKFCTELTTITEFDVMNAPMFPEALEMFKSWSFNSEEDTLFCSWGYYDKKQIIHDCERHNLPYEFIYKHMSLKHEFYKVFDGEKKIPKRGIGMKRALNLLGFTVDGTQHRAIDDAINIGKIFLHYYNHWSV